MTDFVTALNPKRKEPTMSKILVPLLLCSFALACGEADLGPPPKLVPPPPDSPGGMATSDAGIIDRTDAQPPTLPEPQGGLETKSSGLYYGDPYATQGIDYPTSMGQFTCNNFWIGNYVFDVYGGFELVPLPPDPYDAGVRHFRAVFHGTTWAESPGRIATTLDGSVEVKESGYRTLVTPASTCETCSQSGPWPPFGPYFYATNNAYPLSDPAGKMHVGTAQLTVYPTDHGYGPRGWVIAQVQPVWPGWTCGTLSILFKRQDAMAGGGGGGGCPGGPC